MIMGQPGPRNPQHLTANKKVLVPRLPARTGRARNESSHDFQPVDEEREMSN
jgi:hypothetical protein